MNLIGRKLSPRTLRNKLNVSQKLIEDAKELVYCHDTLSFTPAGYQSNIQPLPKPPTLAELAVIPIDMDHHLSTSFQRNGSHLQRKDSSDIGELVGSNENLTTKQKKQLKGKNKQKDKHQQNGLIENKDQIRIDSGVSTPDSTIS